MKARGCKRKLRVPFPESSISLPVWLSAAATALVAAVLPACDFINLPEIKPGQRTLEQG